MAEAAARRGDARVLLVALAFLSGSGFLALHALATPGVLLAGKNAGFQIASAIGLLIASGFAAASALPLGEAGALGGAARTQRSCSPPSGRRSPSGRCSRSGRCRRWTSRSPRRQRADRSCILWCLGAPLLRLRRLPLRAPVASAAGASRARRHLRLGPAGGGDAGDRDLAQLARELVGVAPAHARWRSASWHAASGRSGSARARAPRSLPTSTRSARSAGASTLSVLFADLQAFTTFAERTPPDEVRTMLNAYFSAAAPVLQEENGEIVQTVGDAIFAVFRGEDHEARAARAGLGLQAACAVVPDRRPDWPQFRVGVNSGEAHVGLVQAPGARSYTPTGDVVNTGARLEQPSPCGRGRDRGDDARRLGPRRRGRRPWPPAGEGEGAAGAGLRPTLARGGPGRGRRAPAGSGRRRRRLGRRSRHRARRPRERPAHGWPRR